MKKVYNITTHAQPIFSRSIGGVTIPVLGSVELEKIEAKELADGFPDRFSLVDPSTTPTKHSKKEG